MAPPIAHLASTRYALVIDAGSSGSRLQIYSWQDPEAERQGIISTIKDRWQHQGKLVGKKGKGKAEAKDELEWEIESALRRLVKVEKGAPGDLWIKKAEPGISTIEPEQVPRYLAPLLTHALQQIPPSQHQNTPVYLLATAGMRLLPAQRQHDILEATCKLLRKDYPFRLDSSNKLGPCGESVRIISGEEEGMWGWVAVNYLMDGFSHAPHSPTSPDNPALLPLPELEKEDQGSLETEIPPTLVDPNQHTPTFGFLDMGGASTQIAFSPTFEELQKSGYPADELKSVSLRLLSGQVVEWPVFVASWLGFGTNKARDRYVQLKLDEWKQEELDGLSELVDAIPDPCLPKGLTVPSSLSESSPPFIGTGSFAECLTGLQDLLDKEATCPEPHNHCLFAGLPTPHIDFERDDQRGFIGISEYWYTAQQVLGLGGVWDWGEWEKGMNDFCARDWTDLEQELTGSEHWHGNKVDIARLQMQCFKGAWVSNVLHEGIGIPRIFDAGGNQTLTGGDVGDLNDEAERRAKEKGLIGKKNHFQSMDTIGDTAISWTLGKMVIEASRGVDPHGHSPEDIGLNNKWRQIWYEGTTRVGSVLGVPALENKLSTYGIELFWISYLLLVACVLGVYFSFRRRCWLSQGSISATRRRKQSDVGEIRDWMRRRSPSIPIATDEMVAAPARPRPFVMSRLKVLGYRVAGLVGRASSWTTRTRRMKTTRRDSEPEISMLVIPQDHDTSSYSMSSSLSLPASPRATGEAFFKPAQDVGQNATPMHMQQFTSTLSGPPSPSGSPAIRHGGLTHKSSLSSLRSKRSHPVLPMLSSQSGSTGGWNDPPISVLGLSDLRPPNEEGVLLPNLPLKGSETKAISRNSSRISLSEYGRLAPRPVSRGPAADDM